MGCVPSGPVVAELHRTVMHVKPLSARNGEGRCSLESVGEAMAEDDTQLALSLLQLVSPRTRASEGFYNVAICTITSEMERSPELVEEIKAVASRIGIYHCDPALDSAWRSVARRSRELIDTADLNTVVSLLLAIPAQRRPALGEDYYSAARSAVAAAAGGAELAGALGLELGEGKKQEAVESKRSDFMGAIWLYPSDRDCQSPDSMWLHHSPEWIAEAEVYFKWFLQGTGERKVLLLGKKCSVDFELLTSVEEGDRNVTRKPTSSNVLPLRRLINGRQTHPPPGQPHPWYRRCVENRDSRDWLNNDFFFRAFKQAMRTAGHSVEAEVCEMFDFRYNQDFRVRREEDNSGKLLRAGMEYQEPFMWKKFAVRVKDRYGLDNKWLRFDGSDGEWAIAYNGTSFETVPLILTGGLRTGRRQAYKDHRDARTGKAIGAGIYCTPSITAAAEFAPTVTFEGRVLRFVFQCRVKPEAIKRVHEEVGRESGAYWVINDPMDIRPYGVLVQEAL